jgi:hypothetical protein
MAVTKVFQGNLMRKELGPLAMKSSSRPNSRLYFPRRRLRPLPTASPSGALHSSRSMVGFAYGLRTKDASARSIWNWALISRHFCPGDGPHACLGREPKLLSGKTPWQVLGAFARLARTHPFLCRPVLYNDQNDGQRSSPREWARAERKHSCPRA